MPDPRPVIVADDDPIKVEFPRAAHGPLRHIAVRIALALGLVTFVALLTYLGRSGYVDPEDDSVSLLDAFYYSTVSITTTGYGDIRPITDTTRLATTLLVTPARILFLILLVGTTVEILAQRSRDAYRRARWKRTLSDHIIICGYGVKGRGAVKTLRANGVKASEIVVIEPRPDARARATAHGITVIAGDAASTDALIEAGVRDARSIIVAVDRDDTAVLATLTARELNATAPIVASVREEENVHLLRQSGATSVITSAEAAGRLLGFAVDQPLVTEVLEDLISVGEGLDIAERAVADDECGPLEQLALPGPIVGIVREKELLRFNDARAGVLKPGDRVIYLVSQRP